MSNVQHPQTENLPQSKHVNHQKPDQTSSKIASIVSQGEQFRQVKEASGTAGVDVSKTVVVSSDKAPVVQPSMTQSPQPKQPDLKDD